MPRHVPFFATLSVTLGAGCGGGDDVNQPSTRPEHSISIVSRAETKGTGAFAPNPISVPVNAAVHWYNDDRAAAGGQYGGSNGTIHTITSDDLSFLSGNLTPGRTFEHTFGTPGTYTYHCSIHPAMRGTVTVTP
ncbi:MAG TPA: cupredoxin domain-containing protein [Gemmatimonadales bacterium]|nr:cupredoxin domain-containing protein [Gemmatimonadales bacterium]